MISFSRALRISRPRFWMYLLGPYLLGVTAANPPSGAANILHLVVFALYFTFPANLMVYGVNDICDYDTDRFNPKKQDYEALVLPSERRSLINLILIVSVPFTLLFLTHTPVAALGYLACFVFLSVFYSAIPIRAKAIPIVDSLFNILYALPGFFAYAFAGGGYPPLAIIAACFCWTMAMHAFSAVPDLNSDKSANLQTVATLLGRVGTISACLALYTVASILVFHYVGFICLVLGAVYVWLMIAALVFPTERIMSVYKIFPVINTVVGAILFITIFLSKHFQV